MKREDMRSKLSEGVAWLKQFEERARKLQNQNLADIAAASRGRMMQLMDHPDIERIADDGNENMDGTRIDQSANPGGAVPFDPKAGAPINRDPASVGGPDRGKPDTHVPGEPRFEQPNENFRQPDAVDLNRDGTLRQAPNSLGTQPDVRKE